MCGPVKRITAATSDSRNAFQQMTTISLNALPLMASSVNLRAFERYCKLFLCCTERCRIFSTGPEYAQIHQNDIRNTVSINRLPRVAKAGRPSVGVMSHSRTNIDFSSEKETPSAEVRNCYAMLKFFVHDKRPMHTYYTVRCYGHSPEYDMNGTVKHNPHRFQETYWHNL